MSKYTWKNYVTNKDALTDKGDKIYYPLEREKDNIIVTTRRFDPATGVELDPVATIVTSAMFAKETKKANDMKAYALKEYEDMIKRADEILTNIDVLKSIV